MNDLLNVVERSKDNLLLAEEYIARESLGEESRRPDRAARRRRVARPALSPASRRACACR